VARNPKIPEFEQALDELEQLVERLERGDLPLEDALKTFERGVELTRYCQTALKSAQQRVDILLRRGGELTSAPFEPSEDSASEESATGESAAEPPTNPSAAGGDDNALLLTGAPSAR